MPTPTEAASPVALPPFAVQTWRVHPLRHDLRRAGGVAAAFIAACLAGYALLPVSLWWLPALCLCAALSDYLLPTTYRLTDRGAFADCGLSRLFIAWADVKRATTGPDGIYLSPFARPSRLEAFRGVCLRFAPHQTPDDLKATVRHLWHEHKEQA